MAVGMMKYGVSDHDMHRDDIDDDMGMMTRE